MPTYSCIYHISIFMHISCYVSIFMQISNYVSIFMHAQSSKLSKRKIHNICLNHHASCAYIIVLFHEMKISCYFWDQNPLHSHERLSNPSVSKRRKKRKIQNFASLIFLGLIVHFIHMNGLHAPKPSLFGPSPVSHQHLSLVLSSP